eukprot:tig00020996_g16921.t1
MLEERCFRVAGARLRPRTLANASLSTSLLPFLRRLRRRSKGAGVTGPREQNTTAQFARRLLPQASAARAAFRTCGPVAAGIGLGVHACGRSGAASSSPSPSPSRSRSRAAGASEIMLSAARAERARRSRHQRTRSDRKLIFCLLSSPRPRPRIDSRASLSRRRLEPVKLEALRALLEERAAEKVARPRRPAAATGRGPCGPASSELPP